PVPSHFGQSLPAEALANDSAFGELDLDLDNPEIGKPTSPGALDSTQAFPPEPGTEETFQTTTQKMPLVPNELVVPDKRDEPLAFDMSGFSIDLDKPASATTEPVAAAHADTAVELPSIEEV